MMMMIHDDHDGHADDDDHDDDDDPWWSMMTMIMMMIHDDHDHDDDDDTVKWWHFKKQVVFWNHDDTFSHATWAKSSFRYSGMLIFCPYNVHFLHGRETAGHQVVGLQKWKGENKLMNKWCSDIFKIYNQETDLKT